MLEHPQDPSSNIVPLVPDPVTSARSAGLRYVSDRGPGISRIRRGSGFRYIDSNGHPVRDAATLERIRSLVIPPAWTQVWISPVENGHIQATGRDARGRKQYRYHPRWRQVRDETKFEKMIDFARALPLIRSRVEEDLGLPGLPREKVLATVVRLLEETLIRVGNEEYAKANGSFGLTTLREWHAKVLGPVLHFHFKGKSGKVHSVDVRDPRVARIVRKCQDLPGDELFQYVGDDGEPHTIDSADVNDYLKAVTGHDFTAKDFRTWAATVLTSLALQEFGAFGSKAQAKKNVVEVIKRVSSRLGNTPAICKRCYVHPGVLEAYLDGDLAEALKSKLERETADRLDELQPEEAAVVAFLQDRLKREVKRLEHPRRRVMKRHGRTRRRTLH